MVCALLLHPDLSVSCIAMSVTQPISRNDESSQGMEEEEAQSQLGEVLCHAEQPLQLLSVLQILVKAWKQRILKRRIQMQEGYCGKA